MKKALLNQDSAGFILPRLRVFMSVDLIGSTEYKLRHFNSSESAHKGWAPVLMSFYTDFQNKFMEN